MKATAKRSRSAKAKLSGEPFEVINSLAAILAATSVKCSPAEKDLIGKEFARAFDILADHLARSYEKASPAQRKKAEKSAEAVAEKVSNFTGRIGVCCVGCQDAADRAACDGTPKAGIWACKVLSLSSRLTDDPTGISTAVIAWPVPKFSQMLSALSHSPAFSGRTTPVSSTSMPVSIGPGTT